MIKVKNPAYPVPGLKLFRNIKCPENKIIIQSEMSFLLRQALLFAPE